MADIRQQALRQIYQPLRLDLPALVRQAGISCQLREAVSNLLMKISDSVESNAINPWIPLNTLKAPVMRPPNDLSSLRARVGVFPLAANPIHWGHIITCLFALAELSLDGMVLLPAGEIDYKPIADRERVDETHRHAMVRSALYAFDPLLRYTDVAAGTGNPGEAAVHDLRALNRDRPLDFVLVWGAENEERIERIVRQTARSLKKERDLLSGSPHRLSIVFLRGLNPSKEDVLTEARVSRICAAAELDISVQLNEIDLPVLTETRSTYYRKTLDPCLVPASVHEYVGQNGLYGPDQDSLWANDDR